MSKALLEIKDLLVEVHGKEILKGINLKLAEGETHAIMGPNGSGKSTLAYVLGGREGYEVTGGQIEYLGQNLLQLSVEERARAGIFLGFQYPVAIPGVNNMYFLKAAVNAQRQARGLEPIDAVDFMSLAQQKAKLFEID